MAKTLGDNAHGRAEPLYKYRIYSVDSLAPLIADVPPRPVEDAAVPAVAFLEQFFLPAHQHSFILSNMYYNVAFRILPPDDWSRFYTPNPFSLLHSNQLTPSKISLFFTIQHGNHNLLSNTFTSVMATSLSHEKKYFLQAL